MNSAAGTNQQTSERDDQMNSISIMNQMQSVIKEGEQVQNDLNHYEKELQSFEKQF